ncbi:hypothetical protein VPH35_066043 [Triticum aestivum]|uniref:Uncharacterized protein n=1 Tax=Triticum turgidum subsp. durum TaxID=4567 RepID=A0A9R0SEZ6_TRITD|nr:unnamed protein product [Triticum turgidum subsp. durum]
MDWSSSSSSSSDDLDIEEMFVSDNVDNLVLVHLVNEIEAGLKKKRRGSMVGRLCIPRNRALDDKMLMKDYFAEVPTYPVTSFVGDIECVGPYSCASLKLGSKIVIFSLGIGMSPVFLALVHIKKYRQRRE